MFKPILFLFTSILLVSASILFVVAQAAPPAAPAEVRTEDNALLPIPAAVLYNNVYGIRACALRLSNTYGPRMRVKDARQTFLGVWLCLVAQGQPFEVWEGQQLRDFTYVEDVVDALVQCALSQKTDGQIYNVGGERPYSLHEVAQLLKEVNGGGNFTVKTFPPEAKRIDIGDYYCDWGLLHKAVGWEPRVHLREGLARTLDYYRKNLALYL